MGKALTVLSATDDRRNRVLWRCELCGLTQASRSTALPASPRRQALGKQLAAPPATTSRGSARWAHRRRSCSRPRCHGGQKNLCSVIPESRRCQHTCVVRGTHPHRPRQRFVVSGHDGATTNRAARPPRFSARPRKVSPFTFVPSSSWKNLRRHSGEGTLTAVRNGAMSWSARCSRQACASGIKFERMDDADGAGYCGSTGSAAALVSVRSASARNVEAGPPPSW